MIPFLTLQARSLGINEEEVGMIYSFMSIAALVAPPVSGMIADKIGNFKVRKNPTDFMLIFLLRIPRTHNPKLEGYNMNGLLHV